MKYIDTAVRVTPSPDAFGRSNEPRPSVEIDALDVLSHEAKFFLGCIEKWGMVAGADGGEDSAGRSRLELMPPEDVVGRAREMTDLAFKTIQENEWTIRTPSYDEAVAQLLDRQK